MNDDRRFQRLAAVTSILSSALAFGSGALLLAATSYEVRAFDNPAFLISIGRSGANLLRWGMLLDVLGYYLLLLPLALFLWDWLKPSGSAFVRLYTICGLAYIFIGAMGAVVLAAVLPPLINDYTQATGPQQAILEVVFSGFLNAVYQGLWNSLEVILAGVWWLGIGLFVWRERRALGVATLALGSFAWLDAIGQVLRVGAIFIVGLYGLLVLLPIWALWFGIDLLRRPIASGAGREA